jgi:hypothetical protein
MGTCRRRRAGDNVKGRLPIDVLAADPKNPRQMSDRARDGLGVSLAEFGPLDIVFNETTKQLVSGHQRIAALKAAGATELVRDGDWFYVEHPKTKERFPVRMVEWDETRQRMANLVANNPHIGGTFTADAHAQLKEMEGEEGFELLALNELEKELAATVGGPPDGVDFKEYGEDTANDVKYVECPSCGHKFPK